MYMYNCCTFLLLKKIILNYGEIRSVRVVSSSIMEEWLQIVFQYTWKIILDKHTLMW